MNNYLWLVLIPNLHDTVKILSAIGWMTVLFGSLSFSYKEKNKVLNEEDKKSLHMICVFSIIMSILLIITPNATEVIQIKQITG